MNNEINNRPEEMLCPIINQVISEIECFETVIGFADNVVINRCFLPREEIRDICNKCPYSNIG